MQLDISIRNVQHIKHQHVSLSLQHNKLMCIAGKNSIGKTTLLRAIRNISYNDTFIQTAAPYIFNQDSSITYSVSTLDEDIVFGYNKFINSIDTKQNIPDELRRLINVELAIPHGERFSHFRRLADIDAQLRSKIAVGEFETPYELIEFLNKVYRNNSFSDLREVTIDNKTYYFILKDNDERFYIREDYLSSGEYFVINLYKQIIKEKKLIVIDEIDISLDASAQVNLISSLRELCIEYETNIVFTTHSLALIQTLDNDEIYFMDINEDTGVVSIQPRSFNYVKSIMFGFKGRDKYILTEDKRLEHYINWVISKIEPTPFYLYHVIYIGGGSQVKDIAIRNNDEEFFGPADNILAVLDGDQEGERYLEDLEGRYLLLPFRSIEKEVYAQYENEHPDIPRVPTIDGGNLKKRARNLFGQLTSKYNETQLISAERLYTLLEKEYPEEVQEFRARIIAFLNP
ncbi:AAA family ATPase [Idiomarina sp. OT37-5b]|uniref:AAA family ATPase n=1 Tax=Idiomarina sp. OT37-5b TaxID=2100422 RepID=UPI00131A3B3D|nr:AAA family ATPase [Idiomarina sp. OT37-5b]